VTDVTMLVTSNLVHDNRVRREAETLAEAGFQVTVFSYIAPQDVSRLGWDEKTGLRAVAVEPPPWLRPDEIVADLPQRVRRTMALSASQLQWGGGHLLAGAARGARAGVYHAHDLDTLAPAAWLARRDGGRLVYDSHELFLDQMDVESEERPASRPGQARRRLLRKNFARLERALIGRADAVITVSASIAGELAKRYRIPPPLLVMNCPRYRDMSAGSDRLRRTLGLGPEDRIVLSQGAALPGRGQIELVQALAMLPDRYRLVFLGFNLGTYQEPIRQEIDCQGLASRTHLLDALPPERLPEATASADVGIVLLTGLNKNHRYAMPNKLFEYMMAGLPFVANDLPEISRVAVETGAGAIIPAIAPRAIAGGIREVVEDPARHRRMRDAGLSAARTDYNWSRQAQTLLSLYARLCSTGTSETAE
jgi:glycosyltransferase involved in cell wall biosynthesis